MEVTVLQMLSIGVVLLISEMMVGTLDLISIGLGAIFTAVVMYFFNITDLITVVIIFAVLAIAMLLVMRLFIREKIMKKLKGKEVAGKEIMVGLTLPVSMTNNVKTVYNEGIYIRISNSDDIKVGDMVKVISTSTDSVIVEKIGKSKVNNKEKTK